MINPVVIVVAQAVSSFGTEPVYLQAVFHEMRVSARAPCIDAHEIGQFSALAQMA